MSKQIWGYLLGGIIAVSVLTYWDLHDLRHAVNGLGVFVLALIVQVVRLGHQIKGLQAQLQELQKR